MYITLFESAAGAIGGIALIGFIYHAQLRYRKWRKRRRKMLLDVGTEISQIEEAGAK